MPKRPYLRPILVWAALLAILLLSACTTPSAPVPTLSVPLATRTSTLPPTAAQTTAPPDTPAPASTPVASSPVEFVWKLDLRDLGIGEPVAPFTDKQGNLYFLDMQSERVIKLDADGKLLMTLGEHGSGDGQFNFQPVKTELYGDIVYGGDVVVDQQGNLYVADGGNHRVQVFDAQGKYVRQWGKRGQADGEFEVPWTIAIDGQANLYVGDFTGYIQKFDSSGNFLGRLGAGQGSGEGQFSVAVHDVEADSQGNLYAADFKQPRVQKFDPTGKFLSQWDTCGETKFAPSGLAIDALGNLYIADASEYRICKFDSQGNFLLTWGKLRVFGFQAGEFDFAQAADVAVAPDGSVYVIEDAANRIQKFRLE